MAVAAGLPTGGRGRALALLITLAGIAAIWIGVVAPIMEAYQSGEDDLQRRRSRAQRMSDLVETLPALRAQAEAMQRQGRPAAALALTGATDAVAAASLQGLVEGMAKSAGAKVTSTEALPAEQAGAYRRIGLHVSLDANWPSLINLLRTARQATPRMFVDDLQLHAQPTGDKARELPLDISLTMLAFRLPGEPGAATPATGDSAPAAADAVDQASAPATDPPPQPADPGAPPS